MMAKNADAENGLILINVLAVVALASAVVVTMLTLSQAGLHRSQRFSEAAQALAYSLGAETSAIVALRRDGVEAPEIDHMAEPWTAVAQTNVAISGGSFSLSVEDAQARFNINNLAVGGALALETFRKILKTLEFPQNIADRAFALVRLGGPLSDLGGLRQAGVDPAQIVALATFVTALPAESEVNLNTAPENLLAILLGNPVSARFLVARRDSTGFLTPEDLRSANLLPPAGTGYTSNFFRITAEVRIGDTTQRLRSLLQRRKRGDAIEVVAVERKRGGAVPSPEPPLQNAP